MVDVGLVNYVAQATGYDTEECIRMALEDGIIELFHRNQYGYREYDTYRLTAKGRKVCDRHIREVYQRSAEVARQIEEERQRKKGRVWPALTVPFGRPPASAAGELYLAMMRLQEQRLLALTAARTLAHAVALLGAPAPAHHGSWRPSPVVACR